jgi:K+-transporting ATPase KdpF subunit
MALFELTLFLLSLLLLLYLLSAIIWPERY